MKKNLLLEVGLLDVQILEEKLDERTGDIVTRAQVKWQHVDKINANRRLYPRALLQREIEKLQPLMNTGGVYGAAYHPKEDAELNDVSHLWESVRIEEDGTCTGIVRILPTDPGGKNAQVVIRNGGRLGLSSRGYGTCTRKEIEIEGKKMTYDEVNGDFELRSPGDFVLSPSVLDAGVQRILESRYSNIDDSEPTEKVVNMDNEKKITSVEELRAAYPEQVKVLDDKVTALEADVARLKTEAETTVSERDALRTNITCLVEGIRDVVVSLTELNGVMPPASNPEPAPDKTPPDKPAEKVEPPATEPPATEPPPAEPPAVEPPPAEPPVVEPPVAPTEGVDQLKKQLDDVTAEKQRLSDELAALKEAKAKEDFKKQVDEKIDTLLKDEGNAKLIRDELKEAVFEKLEDVEAKVAAAKGKVASVIAEGKRQAIISSGVSQKGHVGAPEGEGKLTEAQHKQLWHEARKAGYQGDFEQYSKAVLKK